MVGYKGIEVHNGVLRSKGFGKLGDIFEIGVQKEIVNIDDGNGFTENGYSFCSDIALVLPWENYFHNHEDLVGVEASRVFEIEAPDDMVIGDKSHYKSRIITIVREVSKDEIIDFFNKNPDRLKERFRNDYYEFCNRPWKPYYELTEINEIKNYIVGKCRRRTQKSLCRQVDGAGDITLCEKCKGYSTTNWDTPAIPALLYLAAKSKLKAGENLTDIDEYKLLSENKMDTEVRALELLDRHIHS